MQPIHWIKEKYKKASGDSSLTVTIKQFFKDFKPNMQKLFFRVKHLDESNENLAYYHFERGNINDAILRFKIIARINKKPVYNFFLGRLYWEKEKNEEAKKYLDAYLASNDKEFIEEATYCKNLSTPNELAIKAVPTFIIYHNYTKFYFTFEKEFNNSMHYELSSPFFDIIEDHVKQHFANSTALKVLDIGCSDGVLGYCCKRKFKCEKLVGVELVDRLSVFAKNRKYKDFNVYTDVITGDFYEFASKDKSSYHLILAENFISYRTDIEASLLQILNLLARGGILAFSFIETKKYNEAEFLIDEEDFAFNLKYVGEILKKHSLKVIAQKEIKYSPDNSNILMIISHEKVK